MRGGAYEQRGVDELAGSKKANIDGYSPGDPLLKPINRPLKKESLYGRMRSRYDTLSKSFSNRRKATREKKRKYKDKRRASVQRVTKKQKKIKEETRKIDTKRDWQKVKKVYNSSSGSDLDRTSKAVNLLNSIGNFSSDDPDLLAILGNREKYKITYQDMMKFIKANPDATIVDFSRDDQSGKNEEAGHRAGEGDWKILWDKAKGDSGFFKGRFKGRSDLLWVQLESQTF